jgi:hypothetical protein
MGNFEFLKGFYDPLATADMPRALEATRGEPSARGGTQKGAICPSLS